ncbi:MAG: class I SAM-dependent methyltransferase [Proteobacteria bacterium]|nr:class I SAM-dependent methyltransferase [Pseudomonadota bacterium]
MTKLGDHLIECIRQDGPLPVSRFMAMALGHPKWGYYTNRDPIGRGGDFITAPEISQMFGELIGLWCAERWQALGAPDPFIFAELGPGRGTLMVDALRAGGALPGFNQAAQIHLVETSPLLRAAQRTALKSRQVNWHDRIADLPPGPTITIANEFFDALPIRQFQRSEAGWHERMVGCKDGRLYLLLTPGAIPAAPLAETIQHAPNGAIVEVSSARTNAMAELAQNLVSHGGVALIIDYGHAASGVGDTLQAIQAHEFVDVLESPGAVDLTAHVDFQALGEAARQAGARTLGPVSQADFLTHLGIATRAEILQRNATDAQAVAVGAALHRLTDRDQMGQLFKVMAVTRCGDDRAPGFVEV